MLTIYTPTYNRASLLKRIFRSLLLQSCFNFEWLIVDDGSQDNTESVVKSFQENCSFSIRYIKKDNGGKHTAHNVAVSQARGEYILCLDSDDVLAPNAVCILETNTRLIHGNTIGLICYKQDRDGRLLCSTFDDIPVSPVGLFELNTTYKKSGEYAFVFRTEILRSHLFPVFKGETFLGESVLYDKLDLAGFKYLAVPHVLEICEYQENGLSINYAKNMKANPAGFCLYFMQRINLQKRFINRLITAGKYQCFCLYAKGQNVKYSGKYKTEVVLAKPIGYVFWLYYKLLRGF